MADLTHKRSIGDIISGIGRTKTNKTKMHELGERSSSGELSSYSAIFGTASLSKIEKEKIHSIFDEFAVETKADSKDIHSLLEITSEIKAISNQAIIMHGERIKRAQNILKKYRDGAFSEWLMSTYGNRQTPYNFLQYYEFHVAIPKALHAKLDEMPRQAVYTLASRDGEREKKEEIIRNYNGEKKQELLEKIREVFPLSKGDKRAQDPVKTFMDHLTRIENQVKKDEFKPSPKQRKEIAKLLNHLKSIATKSEIEIDV